MRSGGMEFSPPSSPASRSTSGGTRRTNATFSPRWVPVHGSLGVMHARGFGSLRRRTFDRRRGPASGSADGTSLDTPRDRGPAATYPLTRTVLALFDAAQRFRVHDRDCQEHADSSEHAGGRDLRRLVEAGSSSPRARRGDGSTSQLRGSACLGAGGVGARARARASRSDRSRATPG